MNYPLRQEQDITTVDLDDIQDIRNHLGADFEGAFVEGLGPDAHTTESWKKFESDATQVISQGDDAELGRMVKYHLLKYLASCAIEKPTVSDPIFIQNGGEL